MEINPAAASLSPAAINSVGDAARAARAATTPKSGSAADTPGVALDRELLARLRTMAAWDAGSVVGDLPSLAALTSRVREQLAEVSREALGSTHALSGDRVRGLIGD